MAWKPSYAAEDVSYMDDAVIPVVCKADIILDCDNEGRLDQFSLNRI